MRSLSGKTKIKITDVWGCVANNAGKILHLASRLPENFRLAKFDQINTTFT
jgi:hypothetical protein